MSGRFTIHISNKDPFLFVERDDSLICGRMLFEILVPRERFRKLFSKITSACTSCGNFIVDAASFFDATEIDIFAVEDELDEFVEVDVSSAHWVLRQLLVKPVLLSDGDYRDLLARNEPVPEYEELTDYVYLNEESEPYQLKYYEVLLKFSHDCPSCSSVWK